MGYLSKSKMVKNVKLLVPTSSLHKLQLLAFVSFHKPAANKVAVPRVRVSVYPKICWIVSQNLNMTKKKKEEKAFWHAGRFVLFSVLVFGFGRILYLRQCLGDES